MKNPVKKGVASVLKQVSLPGPAGKKLGRNLAENKFQIINVVGAVLITVAILRILQDRRNRRKFQLSDYTEA